MISIQSKSLSIPIEISRMFDILIQMTKQRKGQVITFNKSHQQIEQFIQKFNLIVKRLDQCWKEKEINFSLLQMHVIEASQNKQRILSTLLKQCQTNPNIKQIQIRSKLRQAYPYYQEHNQQLVQQLMKIGKFSKIQSQFIDNKLTEEAKNWETMDREKEQTVLTLVSTPQKKSLSFNLNMVRDQARRNKVEYSLKKWLQDKFVAYQEMSYHNKKDCQQQKENRILKDYKDKVSKNKQKLEQQLQSSQAKRKNLQQRLSKSEEQLKVVRKSTSQKIKLLQNQILKLMDKIALNQKQALQKQKKVAQIAIYGSAIIYQQREKEIKHLQQKIKDYSVERQSRDKEFEELNSMYLSTQKELQNYKDQMQFVALYILQAFKDQIQLVEMDLLIELDNCSNYKMNFQTRVKEMKTYVQQLKSERQTHRRLENIDKQEQQFIDRLQQYEKGQMFDRQSWVAQNDIIFTTAKSIVKHIVDINKRQFKGSRLLYRYSPDDQLTWDHFSNKSSVLVIIQTITNKLIAAYSLAPLVNPQTANTYRGEEKAFIFESDLEGNNQSHYELLPDKKADGCFRNTLVFGNSDLRIAFDNDEVEGYFGYGKTSFKSNDKKMPELLGTVNNKNKTKIVSFQIYKIVLGEGIVTDFPQNKPV